MHRPGVPSCTMIASLGPSPAASYVMGRSLLWVAVVSLAVMRKTSMPGQSSRRAQNEHARPGIRAFGVGLSKTVHLEPHGPCYTKCVGTLKCACIQSRMACAMPCEGMPECMHRAAWPVLWHVWAFLSLCI